MLVLLLHALCVFDHLACGTGIVAPIAACSDERDMPRDRTRMRVIVEGDAIEADQGGSIGATDPHLQYVAERVGVEVEILASVLLRDADDLPEPVDLDDKLGMKGNRGRAGRHQRTRRRRASKGSEHRQAEQRDGEQSSEWVAEYSHERAVNDS